jgi:hypothetical protein
VSNKDPSSIFSWGPVLGEALLKGALGDYAGAARVLGDSEPGETSEPKDVPCESKPIDTERAPAAPIDLVAQPDGSFAASQSAEGCGRTFNRGTLVCIEHDANGECVLARMKA